MITTHDTLGKLAASHPWASRVFQTFKLDYCCQGGRTLDAACREAGLDTPRVLEALEREEQLSGAEPNWEEAADSEIIGHIMGRCHAPLRRELPRLIHMADKVESVHKGKPGVPAGLGELLRHLHQDLESHMADEEGRVFPAILRGQGGLTSLLKNLHAEHEVAGRILHEIATLTSHHTPPSQACTTWKALYLGLAAFQKDLMDHVHLEEHVLFPRHAVVHSPHAQAGPQQDRHRAP